MNNYADKILNIVHNAPDLDEAYIGLTYATSMAMAAMYEALTDGEITEQEYNEAIDAMGWGKMTIGEISRQLAIMSMAIAIHTQVIMERVK